MQRDAVDPDLYLLHPLRLHAGEAGICRDGESGDATQLRCSELGELLPEDWKIASLSVSDARLELTTRTEQTEYAIRGGDLREDVVLRDVTVHAASLGSQTGLHEQ